MVAEKRTIIFVHFAIITVHNYCCVVVVYWTLVFSEWVDKCTVYVGGHGQ